MLIGSGMRRALLLSALVHLLLLLLFRMAPEIPRETTAAPRVNVRLVAPPPAKTPPPAPPPPASRAAPSPAPPAAIAETKPGAPVEPRVPGRWLEDARDVIRDMNLTETSPFRAPDLENPGRREPLETLVPGVEDAFRPIDRRTKICGAMVEFTLGIHRISMPVAYPCEDKEEEFRNAPGAGETAEHR